MAKKFREIEGLEALVKRLEEMGEQGQEMTKEILTEAVKPLQQEIIKRAPDDEPIQKNNKKYGKIKDNIKVEWNSSKNMVEVTSGDAYWSRMVEYGSRIRKKNPFFEKSYLATKKEVEENIIKLSKKKLGLK